MDVAGIQKTSLIDYPGKLSCVIFLSGCNFTCPYCHNPELAQGLYPQRISLEHLTAFLSHRKNLLDGVVITGGEPTLHEDLAELCRVIRDMGYAVKLDTNGSRPELLAHLIETHCLDYIAMDVKTALDAYGPPLCPTQAGAKVAQSIELIKAGRLAYEFRTTCITPFIDEDRMVRLATAIQGARLYTLQSFHAAPMLDANYFKNQSPGIPPETLARLQIIAAPFVEHCTIR